MEQSEFSQSNYFNRKSDHGDTEAAVEFLAEVRVPCLICGVDVEINNIIKREISESEDWVGNTEECHLSGSSEIVDNDVFHGFLKSFGVEIVKKGEQRSIVKGWDGEGGDILRFCAICKMELIEILEFQKQLDELKEKVKNGFVKVKNKMEMFEDTFQNIGIYEKDQRYKMVRSQIVKCAAQISSEHPQSNLYSSLKEPVDTSGRRRSSRIKTRTNVPSSITNHYVDKNNAKVSKDKDSTAMIPSFVDKQTIPNLPDVNSHISSVKTASPKKVPIQNPQKNGPSQTNPKRKKRIVEKIATISEKSVEEKVCRRKSARISSKAGVHTFSVSHVASQDNTNVIIGKSRNGLQRKWDYKLDPSTNTITYGSIKFSIAGDLQQNVSCISCNVFLRNDKKVMSYHIIKHHTNIYACQQCLFKGESKTALESHIQSAHSGHSYGKKIPCKICGKPETTGLTHEWTHMNKIERNEILRKEPELFPKSWRKNWKCEICGNIFTQKFSLKKHKEKYHGAKDKLMETCPKCGKTVKILYYHMRYKHGGSRPFKCTEKGCGKGFIQLCALNQHKNVVHRKLKPWKCTKCTKMFTSNYHLLQHMNLHMGVRPWKCEVEGCGAAFTRKSYLKKHNSCFHEEGSKPKIKPYQRGSTMSVVGLRKEKLKKKGA